MKILFRPLLDHHDRGITNPGLAMVLWALQLMGGRYQLLRQHMKFKLPSDTKELLKEPNETLDKIRHQGTAALGPGPRAIFIFIFIFFGGSSFFSRLG